MRSIKALLANRQGNFAMMTAITLPVLFGVVGAGMEMTRVIQIKADLQNTADAATLAIATEARLDEGAKTDQQYEDALKERYRKATGALEDPQKLEDPTDPIASRSEGSKGTVFNISLSVNHTIELNPLLGFIGAETMVVKINSTAQSTFNKGAAMSMYLVLDRSGSMSFITDTIDQSKRSCANYIEANWGWYPRLPATSPCYINKSASLKTAVSFLVDTLNKSDPTYKSTGSPQSTLVRTGAIAYSDVSFAAQPLDWGTKKANAYVQAIPQLPTGGTNANAALNTAFNALRSSNKTEADAQLANGNKSFQRYIVLMTDGEMTGLTGAWNAPIDNQVRATCAAAKQDDIKIFTIAFMAPAKGQSLLQACATSPENYYAPENMEEIVRAFGDIARKAASVPSRLTN